MIDAVFQVLVDAGADVNHRDAEGRTAAYMSVKMKVPVPLKVIRKTLFGDSDNDLVLCRLSSMLEQMSTLPLTTNCRHCTKR